ncbi:lanthionine synthetase C family protein [Polyangium aurulentum]|uniref:lanthionine synthetase C family protein n=1 Tax=Polyangium aurulentum TaxID=2567896 RepID=UPI0010ADAF11|nr:LanC-like protein [Polyangium aurulentum]UQA60180.1 LanC-like protein [Polyangium aurulentum]
MLFDPVRHEPLAPLPWDAARAREAIAGIVRDAEDKFDARRLWPPHPLDDPSAPGRPFTDLYLGAAGAILALALLRQKGMATLRREPADLMRALLSAFPLPPHGAANAPSFFLGEVGILLAAMRILPDARHEARLAQRIAENVPDPANELFWAAPGTGLAALFLHEWTGAARFRDLAVQSFDQSLARWGEDTTIGCRIWTQRLYGDVLRYIGGAHGFAGNVHALLRASALFSPERLDEIRREAARTAVATAIVRNDVANWPAVVEEMGRINDRWRGLVQWCHGAPGVVIGLAGIPAGLDPRLDEVLLAGGELVYRAGPLRKGPGLCHGTAGNGHALLKLHARTGDARWLARARGFAMHAIEQWKSQRNRHRTGRYGLWTGDLGLALYLSGCIREDAAMPGIDVL